MLPTHRDVCPHEADHLQLAHADWHELAIRTTKDMDVFIADLLDVLGQAGFSVHDRFSIRLALEEAIVNSIKHGHRGDPSKQVHLRYNLNDACLLVDVEDEGPGFQPEEVPDPLAPENIEREGGRGLLLMRCYMTWVRYNDQGNRVVLCKQRSTA